LIGYKRIALAWSLIPLTWIDTAFKTVFNIFMLFITGNYGTGRMLQKKVRTPAAGAL
jgi:hypothetical protein